MQQNSNSINDSIAKLEEETIPVSVAVSKDLEDYENKKVVFSFESYNQNQCELARLDKKDAKRLTSELKKMSTVLAKHLRQQQVSRVACKSINNSRNYSSLFNNLPPDIEILQIDYTSAGRIFGYIIHNIFSIVAVNRVHR